MENSKNKSSKNLHFGMFQNLILIFFVLIFLSSPSLFAQHNKTSKFTQQNSYPLIPFNTNFWNYWDHYWTTWLDGHPKYESIEVTTFENYLNSDSKLIRVFLSEKTGRKEQYFYLNDSLAVKRSKTNAFLRDIVYQRYGDPKSPQNLYLEFTDKDKQRIKWSIKFDSDAKLREYKDGLTPSDHSVGYILLYHLRRKTQSTTNDEVIIDGVDYSFKQSAQDNSGRESWYNKGVYSAVVIFGKLNFKVEKALISNNWGRKFQPNKDNPQVYRSNLLAPENYIEFEVDSLNQIKSYKQVSFGHSFKFSFHQALPNNLTARSGQEIDYSVSFDDKENLMQGKISVKKENDQIVFNWGHLNPAWAKERPFKSIFSFTDEGYELKTFEE